MAVSKSNWNVLLRCGTAAVATVVLSSTTHCRAQFTTVINVPPDVAPQTVVSNTQVNLHDGGTIASSNGSPFYIGSHDFPTTNVEVNVFGGSVGEHAEAVGGTLNILGGVLGRLFEAYSGSTINIAGGYVSPDFHARNGSVVNISGGFVEGQFNGETGSTTNVSGGEVRSMLIGINGVANVAGGMIGGIIVDGTLNFSGGSIGGLTSEFPNSRVNVFGGEFRQNGTLIDGLATIGSSVAVNMATGDSLSGTLSDGTPFVFSSWNSDEFAPDTFTLTAAALPPIGLSTITATVDPVPMGVRQGQTLVVDDGGVLPSIFNAGWGSTVRVLAGGTVGRLNAVGAIVNMSGGTMGKVNAYSQSEVHISSGIVQDVLAVDDSVVNVTGGTIRFIDAISGSKLNISGGALTVGFTAHRDSIVNMTGGAAGNFVSALEGGRINVSNGTIGNDLKARGQSIVKISGGSFGSRVMAESGSTLDIAGGSYGDQFQALSGSALTIRGGEFRINGMPIDGLGGAGSSLKINLPAGGVLDGVLADGTPFAFHSRNQILSPLDEDIISQDTLEIVVAELPAIGPALINVTTDDARRGIRNGQTMVVNNGGAVGDNFNAGRGSSVQIREGGSVGSNFEAAGAAVDILGGNVGNAFDAFAGSVVNIKGGTIGESFTAHAGSVVNISGGIVRSFAAFGGSTVNLRATEFLLNGNPITGLIAGQQIVLSQRTGELTGRFADGSAFGFPFGLASRPPLELISPNALMTLTLVPEPTGIITMLFGATLQALAWRTSRRNLAALR